MGTTFNPFTGQPDFTGTASAPTGTPNRFAGYDSLGALVPYDTFRRNALFGMEENIADTPADTGSLVYNANNLTLAPSVNLAASYIWENLDQIILNGANDYLGVTGRELFIQQTAANNITDQLIAGAFKIQLGVGGGTNTANNVYALTSSVRASGGNTSNFLVSNQAIANMDGATTSVRVTSFEGSTYVGGTTENAYGLNQYTQAAGGSTIISTLTGILNQVSADAGSAVAYAFGLNMSVFGDVISDSSLAVMNLSGNVGGSAFGINLSETTNVTGDSTPVGIYAQGNKGANLRMINSFSTAVTSNDFFHFAAGNNGDVLDFSYGVSIADNNTITKGVTAFQYTHNGDIGDGTGINANILTSSLNGGTIDGNVQFLSFFSNSDIVGSANGINIVFNGATHQGGQAAVYSNSASFLTYNLYGYSLQNTGAGESINGFIFSNSGDMTQEVRPINIDNNSDCRTATGIQISLSGNATDDVQAIRISMSGQSSTNQEPNGIQVNMPVQTKTTTHVIGYTQSNGLFQVQGQANPINGATVDIGNNYTITEEVISGSPLTGTDVILQIIQSNLLANDDIATGPIGLDTNMLGLVSQVAVASGKTVPLLRSALLGTSVPSGSGGTITEHVILELFSLPSFGGSVTCPTKIGIQDSILLGQNFSDGATDAWFLRVRDPNAENHLTKLALGTSNMKVSNDSVALELGGTTRVLRHANLTTAERNALTPLAGMQIFNTDTLLLEFYDGTNWV